MRRPWAKSKNRLQLYMFFSKLQLVCIWAPATRREVCPRLLQSLLIKILQSKYNLRNVLPNLRKSKYPIFRSQQKSNKSQPLAPKWCQHRDQLSLGYDTGVWTADEVKFPCEGQLGSECSPEMQWWKEIYLQRERKISSQSTPLINSAEHHSSLNGFWFSSSVKFVWAIFLRDTMRGNWGLFYTSLISFGWKLFKDSQTGVYH